MHDILMYNTSSLKINKITPSVDLNYWLKVWSFFSNNQPTKKGTTYEREQKILSTYHAAVILKIFWGIY